MFDGLPLEAPVGQRATVTASSNELARWGQELGIPGVTAAGVTAACVWAG
jgi:hypothetical protein